jgi:putative iron-only hydrogenase system regulator
LDTRIALIGIIVEDTQQIDRLNAILHEYRDYIVGRMGIPYRNKGVSIISIVIDAENDIISALSGKIGNLKGINTKTVYTKK